MNYWEMYDRLRFIVFGDETPVPGSEDSDIRGRSSAELSNLANVVDDTSLPADAHSRATFYTLDGLMGYLEAGTMVYYVGDSYEPVSWCYIIERVDADGYAYYEVYATDTS